MPAQIQTCITTCPPQRPYPAACSLIPRSAGSVVAGHQTTIGMILAMIRISDPGRNLPQLRVWIGFNWGNVRSARESQ